MKHIPPPPDLTNKELDDAFYSFKCKTLWKYYFERTNLGTDGMDEPDRFIPKLKPSNTKPKPCPFVSTNTGIVQTLNLIQERIQNYKTSNPVSRKSSSTLKQLSILKNKYQEIIFRPADKNLGLCALHISHYNNLVMEHLENKANYNLCAQDSLSKARLYQNLLKEYHSFLGTMLWYDHERPLINHHFFFTFPKFHLLPKLHKSGPIKGRPIAGQVNWITTPISKILDHRLQSSLHSFQHILKNSDQLAQELQVGNDLDTFKDYDCSLITADISSLYPNMDISRLLKIVDKIDNTCTPLVEFVCKHSYVEYNDKIYHQINGIPMGTNAAVTLANMYVGSLIDTFIATRPQVIYYKRYIDDLFIIWKGDLRTWDGAKRGITRMLGIPINFDQPSKDSAIFLDLQIKWNHFTGKLDTAVYQKPLNKYRYITPSSCHTSHMFRGFINGELTRYARLSSTAYAYSHTKKLFYQRLVQRGYQHRYLTSIFKRHRWTSRLKVKDATGPSIIPFIIPHTLRQNSSALSKIIKDSSEELCSHFIFAKSLTAYQRRRSIGDVLCPSALTQAHQRLLKTATYQYGPKENLSANDSINAQGATQSTHVD